MSYHEYLRARACTGKARYLSRSDAKRQLRRSQYGRGMSAYPCQFCIFFHIGHRDVGTRGSSDA